MNIFINKRKCLSIQEICKAIPACPTEALSYVIDENEPLGGRIVIDSPLCNECAICILECCGNAIEKV